MPVDPNHSANNTTVTLDPPFRLDDPPFGWTNDPHVLGISDWEGNKGYYYKYWFDGLTGIRPIWSRKPPLFGDFIHLFQSYYIWDELQGRIYCIKKPEKSEDIHAAINLGRGKLPDVELEELYELIETEE